jgi:DNA repair protein RecO (recombination protein O)
MLVKTRGIVLRNVRYGETSLITDIYTRELGLQSYLIQGARKPRAPLPASLFQVMTILDLVVHHQEKSSLKRIREVAPGFHYQYLQRDIRPNATGLFLIEVIRQALPHTEPHAGLFEYLEETFTDLDRPETRLPVYLLERLLGLTALLGFHPGGAWSADRPYFDLREGHYCGLPPPHPDYLLPEAARALSGLYAPSGPGPEPEPDNAVRRVLLQGLLDYYRFHLDHFREPRSQAILRQVLHPEG